MGGSFPHLIHSGRRNEKKKRKRKGRENEKKGGKENEMEK